MSYYILLGKQELFIKIVVNQTDIGISFTVIFSTASMREWKAKFLKNKYCLSGLMAQFWKKGTG